MPCTQARARQLLTEKKAAVYKRYPFTIILKTNEQGMETQPIELKFDPGSKTTGIALVGHFERGSEVLWGAELVHRSYQIKDALESRRALRRGRRNRKTRYRQPRFLNRCRPAGWLPPSVKSVVLNVKSWSEKLLYSTPIQAIAVESVKFDTQKMVNPEIDGVEYQQGELAGYEAREYLLNKFQHTCMYCGKKDVPLQVEHIVPRSKGGSNRISNLGIACVPCNQKKSNKPIEDFVKDKTKLAAIKRQLKAPLRDAAKMNATRYAIGDQLKATGLPTTFSTGGRTKFNRTRQGYVKGHWIDAACVGETGASVKIPYLAQPLIIGARGHGNRQLIKTDKYGFPRMTLKGERIKPATIKRSFGFSSGDIVEGTVTKEGVNKGVWIGPVGISATGSFVVLSDKKNANGKNPSINHKNCKLLQRNNGYSYSHKAPITTKQEIKNG